MEKTYYVVVPAGETLTPDRVMDIVNKMSVAVTGYRLAYGTADEAVEENRKFAISTGYAPDAVPAGATFTLTVTTKEA